MHVLVDIAGEEASVALVDPTALDRFHVVVRGGASDDAGGRLEALSRLRSDGGVRVDQGVD